MAEIGVALDELPSGRGSLFLITGEPGIGKTRLADEVGRTAAARGVSVHWGRAWEVGGARSYWPLIQALRTMSSEGARVLATTGEMPVDRFELFERVDAFLSAATQTPRLMVLDDLHAADASSLQLLHFIVRDLRSRPLMVVATYREAEARLAPEVGSLLAQMAREGCVLPLRRWERDEVALFVKEATGVEPSDDRVDELHRQTEGNPLFLRELLQLSGVDAERSSAHAGRSDGIQQVIRARIALLPRESRALLEAAAVLGREFSAPALAAVAGMSETDARVLVEPAAQAAVVETLDQPPRWRFTHVLLREGLYADLPMERRASLHRDAAAYLARTMRTMDGPPLAEIAHHLGRAVPEVSPLDAARATLRAAEGAMEALAFEDALALFGSAETLVEGASGDADGLRFDATLGFGLACMRMAEVDRGRRACARAVDIARRLGDSERFARAVLGPGYEHVPWERDTTRIALLEEALARLPAGDGALRAQCMAELASTRLPEPDIGPLVDLARQAVAMARRVGDAHTVRLTMSASSFAKGLYVDPAERIIDHQELLRLSLAAGDKRLALRAHGLLTADFWENGDPASAAPHSRAATSLAREFRHGRFEWFALIFRAAETLAQGCLDDARQIYADAKAVLEQDEARGALLAGTDASLACVTERYDDAAGLEADLRSAFGSLPHELGGLLGEMLIAKLRARAGDRTGARAQLETVAAHPLFDAIREPTWLVLLADACHVTGDAKLAARVYAALLPCAARFVWLGPLNACIEPPFARALGVLAETLARPDDAVGHLEDAEARTRSAGMRCHYARLWFELARALLARDGAGDRARALALVDQARALATELGQTGLLQRLADTPPKRATPPSDERVSLSREGETWCVAWQGRCVRLKDSRGLSLLAQLVENEGQELHVLQLAAGGDAPHDSGDAGPVLDTAAVQSYRGRLLDLREELEEAERVCHDGRAEKAKTEIDFLTQELARAVGLGGRERRAGQAAERARTAVQKRLREAIRRLEAEIPELGVHLDRTIRTGVFCGYLPGRRRS
jgi:hypothetical protein